MRHPALLSLSRGHHEVLILAMKCRKRALGQTRSVGARGLADLAEEVKNFVTGRLERHFQAEETVLFPLLDAATAESRSLTAELRREHALIREKASLGSGAVHLSKALFDLADLLERHVRREERVLFPIFEREASKGEAERVRKEMEEILQAPEARS